MGGPYPEVGVNYMLVSDLLPVILHAPGSPNRLPVPLAQNAHTLGVSIKQLEAVGGPMKIVKIWIIFDGS